MKSNIRRILIFLLLIAFGISGYLVFRPWHTRAKSRAEAEKNAETFLQANATNQSIMTQKVNDTSESEDTAPRPKAELYEAMRAYNERIYQEGQSGLCDPWSYSVPAIDLSTYGLDPDEAIGVLQIPSIGVSLPLYSGASSAHLDKGAAVLSQTSLPIGGDNTNTVIGAHRGWNAEDYLRDVEDVQLGDEIIITNFWGELRYTVSEIKVIEPDDIKQILIQSGRELLTVFTCHPYASGGRYRYLLICERVQDASPEVPSNTSPGTQLQSATTSSVTVNIAGTDFVSSAPQIQIIAVIPWLGVGITLLLLLAIVLHLLRRRKSGRS